MSNQDTHLPTSLYPFLAYQKNSFMMRRILNEEYVPRSASSPLLFRKPENICRYVGQTLPTMWKEKYSFSEEWRKRIEANINSFGLELRVIKDVDTPGVKAFLDRRYPSEIASEICAFDLWRFRKFGHGVILLNAKDEIMGTIFELGYDTMDKTSFTIRMAVDESLKGNNLGYHLMIYSSLLAMEQGSRVKRGIIQVENIRSLYINLNKVGWICDSLIPQITGLGTFFEIALPLDPMGLTANVIDQRSLIQYIQSHKMNMDFLLIHPEDTHRMRQVYAETDFKICAVVKPGGLDEQYWLFALPASSLQLDPHFQ
ncbi:MAG: hypothetical protein AAF587_31585 [Bacteroidota bacterium]